MQYQRPPIYRAAEKISSNPRAVRDAGYFALGMIGLLGFAVWSFATPEGVALFLWLDQ